MDRLCRPPPEKASRQGQRKLSRKSDEFIDRPLGAASLPARSREKNSTTLVALSRPLRRDLFFTFILHPSSFILHPSSLCPSTSSTTRGGIGQSSLSQIARNTSISRIVTWSSARLHE